MFAFGDKEWPGVAKFIEESGEMGQVIGRLMMLHGRTDHWSGADLRRDFVDELADVKAAIQFIEMKSLTDEEVDRVRYRADTKIIKFLGWHREQSNGSQKLKAVPGRILEDAPNSRPSGQTEHRIVLRAAGIPSEGCGGEHSAIMEAIGHGS